MPIELEAKAKVDTHDAVRAKLARIGAKRIGCVIETNRIFDNADRTLLSGGCGLRIRVCQALDGPAPAATLTYKGPRQPGPLKKREEIQIAMDDAEAGCTLLERLGFVQVLCFEKRRESWHLDTCRIELDEVPHLGCYVEIEAPDEQAIGQARQALDLGDETTVPETYIALLVDYCRQNNLPTDQIGFREPGGCQ